MGLSFIKFFGIGIVLITLTGCASKGPAFNVGINSYGRTIQNSGSTYLIFPSEEGVNVNDLEFVEFSAYLERALETKGMTKSDDFASADLAIFMAYGIGDPETSNYTIPLPIFGKTGVSSSYTSGTVNLYGNTASYSGQTTYTPTYGITGYNNIQGSITSFTRHAFLKAYDLNHYRKTEEEVVVWDTRIVSTGSSGDLRQVFPVLMAAAMDHIGTNTGKMIFVTLNEEDPDVRFLKGQIQVREK